MKLYSVLLSPFAARVWLSIYRKGLNIEVVPPPEGVIKGDAYLTLNPMGQILTLVLDSGIAIPESATILEYLEDVFPTLFVCAGAIALLFSSLWALLLLLLLTIVQIGIVRREEVYLEHKFGDKYLYYKASVRCWV
jgi:glutathione S-transferase